MNTSFTISTQWWCLENINHYNWAVTHKIANLWKCGLNWSSKLRENNEWKNKLLLHKIVCFQMLEKGFMPEAFLRLKFLGKKLPLSLKLHYFKEGRFCQCFITSTALQCSLPSKFLWSWIYQRYTLSFNSWYFSLMLTSSASSHCLDSFLSTDQNPFIESSYLPTNSSTGLSDRQSAKPQRDSYLENKHNNNTVEGNNSW